MQVTVINNPEMKDYVLVSIHYKLGNKVLNLHNDVWVDVVEALKAYWKAGKKNA